MVDLSAYTDLWSMSFSEGMATKEDQVRARRAEVTNSAVEELNSEIEKTPNDADLYIKKGIAYSNPSFHHQEAIDTFSKGIMLDPFNALLYRWRGHKHINVREINAGRADLEMATRLDPLNWDSWYHLGLGHYLAHDFERAEAAYRRCWDLTTSNDNRVAVADWLYMTLMRQGKTDEAQALLSFVNKDMEFDDPEESSSYFQRLLLYKGIGNVEELLKDADKSGVEYVTLGYGLGNHYFCAGDKVRAAEIWSSVLEGKYWSAFGYIASEIDLAALEG